MATYSQKFDALDGLVISGELVVSSNLAIDTNVLYVDTVNNRVGVNKVPTTGFDVSGSANISGSLTVSTDITGVKIKANDYFIENKVAATTGTGVKTYDLNAGSSFEHTASGNFTANFTNVPASDTVSWTLRINNSGTARTVTWQVAGAAVVKWSEGVMPPPSAGVDIYSFISIAGTVYASLAMRNAS